MPRTPRRPTDPAWMGPYRLLDRLGEGGMGTVFLGLAPDGRAVAVKVLRDGVSDPLARRRFREEVEALRRVRGRHLVEVLDADVEAETPYLVTRFVPGARLDERVTSAGPLPPGELLQLACGLADALTVLHDAGLVHRDLSPANVLLLDGQPQVIDLGLATAAEAAGLTRSLQLVGTPGYTAPEQILDAAQGAAVDIHGWGATVAFAGTGRPPYGTGRPDVVLYRIVHDPPDLDGLPAPLDVLVAEALDADPRRRPTAHALLGRLADIAQLVTVPLARTAAEHSSHQSPSDDEQPPEAGSPTSTLSSLQAPAVSDPGPDPDSAAPISRSPVRRAQSVVVAALSVLAVAALTLAAPVAGGVLVVLLLSGLRAVARAGERLRGRRDRRGVRRRDATLAAVGTPWHLLRGLLETAGSLPLLLVVAGPFAGLVWLLDPELSGGSLDRPELTAATAAALCVLTALCTGRHRHSRRLLARTLVRLTPGPLSSGALLLVLIAVVGLLVATAEGSSPSLWPLAARR